MEVVLKSKIDELLEVLRSKNPGNERVVIGLDGFVDKILHVVNKRKSPEEFERLRTMKEYGERIVNAAGLSTNFEMVLIQEKLGGNGPILSNALATYGVQVTYIGALGYPYVEKVFQPMVDKISPYSIASPGYTDAIEFDDGKIMVGKLESLKDVKWDNIKKIIGIPKLIEIVSDSKLLGLENWTMLPYMSNIWRGLMEEVLPHIDLSGEKRFVFFDLADPERRTSGDILEALELIKGFSKYFNVMLGLNFKEGIEISEVLGLKVEKDNNDKVDLKKLVEQIAKKLNIYALVIHPTTEAASYIGENYYHAVGPYTPKPKLTTGAGDNFNAGFCLGQLLNLNPEQSLILGGATSGYYVRNAKSPTFQDVIEFLDTWSNDKL